MEALRGYGDDDSGSSNEDEGVVYARQSTFNAEDMETESNPVGAGDYMSLEALNEEEAEKSASTADRDFAQRATIEQAPREKLILKISTKGGASSAAESGGRAGGWAAEEEDSVDVAEEDAGFDSAAEGPQEDLMDESVMSEAGSEDHRLSHNPLFKGGPRTVPEIVAEDSEAARDGLEENGGIRPRRGQEADAQEGKKLDFHDRLPAHALKRKPDDGFDFPEPPSQPRTPIGVLEACVQDESNLSMASTGTESTITNLSLTEPPTPAGGDTTPPSQRKKRAPKRKAPSAATKRKQQRARERERTLASVPIKGGGEGLKLEDLVSYRWPQGDPKAEFFMLQEQLSTWLELKSFRRRFPNLVRRSLDREEREHVMGLSPALTEAVCDLGLTALSTDEVLHALAVEFPGHCEQLRRELQERVRRARRERKEEERERATSIVHKRAKAMAKAAAFNEQLNSSRKRHYMELNSFVVQLPQSTMRVMPPEATKPGIYPIALTPAQYCDFYKTYTSAELKYMPVNTVLYGPINHGDMIIDEQFLADSEEEREDEEGVKEEGISSDEEGAPRCKACQQGKKNKQGRREQVIQCSECATWSHPSCIDLDEKEVVERMRSYPWQCMDCKTCYLCKDVDDEDKMIFCDMCDRGYHIYCIGLRRVPNGRWHCGECAQCDSCGSTHPAGKNPDETERGPTWQHEYDKIEDGIRRYSHTLCVPCSKLYHKGKYCSVCHRCFDSPSTPSEGWGKCRKCGKYLHVDCATTQRGETEQDVVCPGCKAGKK
ncbi:unnamed protein product [Cyprideis torosa]|uniref:PHD finger protein 10 n=1 Tax=Cyprideis torosa TaxID=163714 RepID=A0A7R8ZN86_9CRUS|nr:unnamed protein product [Cyprideis torosa]CAG0897414.1 unnamed protein product [Cyprideis torosa]